MTGTTGRYALLEQLAADGVEFIFGNPGTVEQGFLDALEDEPRLRYIMALQETIAVAAADGYARATKRPAVVQLHSGVGLGNGVGMMYQAKRGEAPLVVLAGESGLLYDAMDAQMAADLVAIAEPVTKWATRVVHPSSLLRVVRRAMKIAATPPMGPVFVSLPMDVLDAPAEEEVVPTSYPVTRVAPEKDLMYRAAAMLAGANRPLLIAGDGIAASGAQSELCKVAELTGAEVWEANGSEVNLNSTHPQYRGALGHMFGDHSRQITRAADVILISGTYVFPEVFPALHGVFAQGAQIIHIDLNGYEIGKNFPVGVGIVSDPIATLGQLANALEQLMSPAQRESATKRAADLGGAKERDLAAQKKADEEGRDSVPLRASQFMAELAARLPADAVIFDEALTTSPELTRYLPPRLPGHYFQTRGGSLGVGFPGAIGLKLAHPDKTVVGFSGDGGAMYTIQALWTAAHHDVDVKFVVCNNRSYRILKHNIQQYWYERDLDERAFPGPFDITSPNLDFAGLATSMGVKATRVETPDQIGPAIDEALAHSGPFLIDLIISGAVANHFVYVKAGQ
jgi:thiamine pyrophosphate-dependent acetolactate synthase large subunit-like protein